MSGIEIFSLVVEVVGLAKKAWDVADKAAHAEQTLNSLVERLQASKKALESATSCFESLPVDDRPTDLVNSVLAKYSSLLLYMRDELQNTNNNNNKSEGGGQHLRRVFSKVSKGAKWVIKEEWVQGRIDEIRELEKVIQDTLQVLTTVNSHGAAKTTVEVQKLLQKVNETTEVTNFFSEVGKLYRVLEKNPQQILARIERSPPSWVLDEPPAKEWVENETSGDDAGNWLWILGDAGTGKSCIATYVSHTLQGTPMADDQPITYREETLSELNRPSQLGSEDRHVLPIRGSAIYYCNYQSPESQVPERVALTLLHQLMTQLWEIAPHRAYRHLAAVRDLTTFQGTQRSVQDAFRVLLAVAESFDRLYVTIDALDELPISSLATLLQRLRRLALPGVKFFVTSRDASRVLPAARTVNANRNSSTIRAFVHEKLKSIAGGRDPDVSWPVPLTTMLADDEGFSKKVEERILELSGENFFCADLMIKQLLDCQEEDEVQQSLDNLSRTVDGLITQAIDRINAQDATQAARGNAALLWVIYTRGLSIGLTELQHALAFQFYGDNPTTSPESHLSEFSRPKLTKFTCNFLSFEGGGDSGGESISVHKAVQDFCVGEGMGAQYFHDPHAVISRVCLWCLSVNKEPCRSREDWERLQPFLRYAASNWGWHMAASSQTIPECPPPNMGLMELLEDDPFLDIVTVALQPKLKELGMWTKDMWDELRTKKPPVSALQILAFFDLDRVVAEWLERSPTTTKDTADYKELLSSALYLAAIQGSHRTALVLLKKGADPLREIGEMGITILQGACLQGHVNVIDALFRNTSDELCVEMVSHKDRHNRTALFDSCYSSIHAVRRILGVMSQMDKPAAREVLLHQSGRVGQGGTAMHSAADADNADVIDELLNFRPGGHLLLDEPCRRNGETPLHRAARVGSANAVRRLLERGANPNALDQHGNTPAMLAANEVASLTGGCLELLLPHANLKVQNTIHRRNILHTACHFGRARHVKAILPYLENDHSVLSAREDGNLLPIMCASLRPHHFKFLCIEYLIPLMGRELLPVKDAQELQRILMRYNQPQAFALLLKEFPDQQKLMMNKRSTLLSKAIGRGNLPIVEAILTVYGKADLEVRNPEGLTPLMQAAHLGFSDIVRYLLDNGADINAISSGDQSALEWCAELNDADIVEAIWQHDPDLLKPNPDDEEILNIVSARNHVRKLWLKHNVVPGLDKPVQEIQCLHSLREDPDEVSVSGKTNQDIYIESDPIPETAKIPLSRLRISISAQDQGWSDHVVNHAKDKNSIRGSQTWLEIAVKRGDELIRQVEFSYIKLNTNEWNTYQDTWEVDGGFEIPCKNRWPQNYDTAAVKSLMAMIRPGDRICVVMRAQFQGWICRVSRAELTAWYED
ncbi:hypothetical protein F4802DRAFT_446650 [Xylaria palmicola]|nr:hypothetical protein F4802DRAFT_446650 [Xylaria palmicola]